MDIHSQNLGHVIMLKSTRFQIRDKRELLQSANHLFFMTGFMFMAIHQNVLHPEKAHVEVPMVAQALHFQPRMPPPGMDPEQINNEEIDWSARPEMRPQ